MKPKRSVNRLQLGPVVGHTDNASARIWIRVRDDPADYMLRVKRHGFFPFQSTGNAELGTALALAEGLRSDWRYEYQILRRRRVVPGGFGSFRTMPDPVSMADVQFVAVSCSAQDDEGAWAALSQYVQDAEPRFLILMGDQVYLDSGTSVWHEHFDSEPGERRAAMAEKYQENWSREAVQSVLANIPTYMMWDDHEIRDGWGSFAPGSPDARTAASRRGSHLQEARRLLRGRSGGLLAFPGLPQPAESARSAASGSRAAPGPAVRPSLRPDRRGGRGRTGATATSGGRRIRCWVASNGSSWRRRSRI